MRNKNHVVAEIVEFVKKNYPNQAGIIYCESRSKCQGLSEVLEVQLFFYLVSYQILELSPLIILYRSVASKRLIIMETYTPIDGCMLNANGWRAKYILS